MALAVSCVTVNVNFPESAVQRAADDFVRDLYKGTTAVASADEKQTASDAASMKDSMKKSSKKKSGKLPAGSPAEPEKKPTTYHFSLIDSAYAIEVDARFKDDTPRALSLKRKMESRASQIHSWKEKGAICETMQGILKLSNPAKAGGDAAKVSALVKSENDDREALYEELTEANKDKQMREEVVRRNFATAFRSISPDQGKCE